MGEELSECCKEKRGLSKLFWPGILQRWCSMILGGIKKVDRFGSEWFTDGAGGREAMEVILKMLQDKIFLITGPNSHQ